MLVHFLRHAQSIFNANLTSEKDCDLTELGEKQASELKGHYDVVFCSPMKRTQRTLALSKITYDRLIVTPHCREKRVDICDYLPEEDESVKETKEELEARIRLFLTFLKSQISRDQLVLVVSHGDFIHAVGQYKGPYPLNAEIQQIEL